MKLSPIREAVRLRQIIASKQFRHALMSANAVLRRKYREAVKMDIIPEKTVTVEQALRLATACNPEHVLILWEKDGGELAIVHSALHSCEVVWLCEKAKDCMISGLRTSKVKP